MEYHESKDAVAHTLRMDSLLELMNSSGMNWKSVSLFILVPMTAAGNPVHELAGRPIQGRLCSNTPICFILEKPELTVCDLTVCELNTAFFFKFYDRQWISLLDL